MSIEFRVVKRPESIRQPQRERRSWTALVTQIAGVGRAKAVFVPLDAVSDADVKYLTLALSRHGKGIRLHTRRGTLDGVEGRFLWSERDGKRT